MGTFHSEAGTGGAARRTRAAPAPSVTPETRPPPLETLVIDPSRGKSAGIMCRLVASGTVLSKHAPRSRNGQDHRRTLRALPPTSMNTVLYCCSTEPPATQAQSKGLSRPKPRRVTVNDLRRAWTSHPAHWCSASSAALMSIRAAACLHTHSCACCRYPSLPWPRVDIYP